MAGGEHIGGATRRRWNNSFEQARAAWLIGCDLAAGRFGGDLRVVVQGTGKRGRGSDAVTAKCRKVACYLATVVANVSPEQLAKASGLNRATVHKHAGEVEDWREDARFDADVAELENVLFSMAARVVLARLGELPAEPGQAA